MAVQVEVFVKLEKFGKFFEKVFVPRFEKRFIGKFDGGSDDFFREDAIFFVGDFFGKGREFAVRERKQTFSIVLYFFVGFDGSVKTSTFFQKKQFGTRKNRGEEAGRILGQKKEVVVRLGLFESFQKGVGGLGIHLFGRTNEKKGIGKLLRQSILEKIADSIDGNFVGFFVRLESEKVFDFYRASGRRDKNGEAGPSGDGGDFGDGIKKHG